MPPRRRKPGIRVLDYTSLSSHEMPYGSGSLSWATAVVHVKSQTSDKPMLVANEFVFSRLAAQVGLPVLPGEVAEDADGRLCWITPQIQAEGTAVPPADASAVAASYPDAAAGVLVFDAWIGNDDRTDENVLFDPRLGLWLIDHERALGGPESIVGTDLARLSPVSHHLFESVDLDGEALVAWKRKIETGTSAFVTQTLDEAVARGLMSSDVRRRYRQSLTKRRGELDDLVRRIRREPARRPSVQLSILGGDPE